MIGVVMLFTPTEVKVYLGLGATDMRKSIDSLSVLVSEHLNQEVFSGHLFVFCNRRRTILKILYWDRNGFCLWHKRLEREQFRWPVNEEAVGEISSRELHWLIEGLDIHQAQAHGELNYGSIY
jgi:transposase